jgi:hypothetical protein
MYHPHFTEYVNEYLDLTLRDLDSIHVTVPIFNTPTGEPQLYICSVEIGHGFTDGHRDVASRLFEHYVRGLERKSMSLSKKLSGADPEQYKHTRARLTQHYPRPTQLSLDICIDTDLGRQCDSELTSCERTHLGALYSAIFNGGYVLHKGRVATFKSSYFGHFPHFKLKKVINVIPYPKKKVQKNEEAATVA